MNVSIIIPVYNEASQLDACLSAIAVQGIKPFEVIVIDNNSTDDSLEVAGRYGFVKLLSESRQGLYMPVLPALMPPRATLSPVSMPTAYCQMAGLPLCSRSFQDKEVQATSGNG